MQYNILKHFWKSIVLSLCILYLSFAPSSTFTEIPTFKFEDKIVHLLMYLTLTFVLLYEYKHQAVKKGNIVVLLMSCLFYPVLLGSAIEIFQPIVSHSRNASWADASFNAIGTITAWIAFFLYFRLTKKR